MTIKANAWCTVHYTTQNFKAIPEIGQLHNGLGSQSCHFGPFFFTFALARVYRVWFIVRRLVLVLSGKVIKPRTTATEILIR